MYLLCNYAIHMQHVSFCKCNANQFLFLPVLLKNTMSRMSKSHTQKCILFEAADFSNQVHFAIASVSARTKSC